MLQVCLACIPGLIALVVGFGTGVIFQVLMACAFALGVEALVAITRRRPVAWFWQDGSALVTGLLLGLALPPALPWYINLTGVAFAILVAKQLYGGLGYNPFNPAMAGYAFLLVSFPVYMTQWNAPVALTGDWPAMSGSLAGILGQGLPDALSGATPLDMVKNNTEWTLAELYDQQPGLSGLAGHPAWLLVNLGFMLGGLYLLARKIITWHIPVSMLVSLVLMALIFRNGDGSGSHGGLFLHLLSGATMLGAFFIATDPVSAATSNRGKLFYGAGIGILVYVIRAWGGFPDGVAFAVLLMNLCAPAIDYYTRPRVYGHHRSRQGFGGSGGSQ
jgi:electron transport complex protein RnfD